MNTELLREDERGRYFLHGGGKAHNDVTDAYERLIEEREKNYDLTKLATVVETELAKARKDSERLDWLLETSGVVIEFYSDLGLRSGEMEYERAAIDAAMKEVK